jgi:DNA-binding response OmpR family regulator
VLEAADTDEASAILGSGRIAVDIVLADVKAPGSMNGFALAVWIRKSRPRIRVLLAGSAATEAAEAADLCEEGPRLAKPYDRQILLDRIKRSLANRGPDES